jgi:hypothetical protein
MHKYVVPESVRARVIRLQGKPFALDRIDARAAALVVVDMQNYYVAEGYPNESPNARAIVPSINRMAAALRAAGGRVVWVPDRQRRGARQVGQPSQVQAHARERGAAAEAAVGERRRLQALQDARAQARGPLRPQDQVQRAGRRVSDLDRFCAGTASRSC